MVLIMGAGFGANGPKTLCGMAVRETHKEAPGTAGGALGLIGQIGAALSGYPVGLLLSHGISKGLYREDLIGSHSSSHSWGLVLLLFLLVSIGCTCGFAYLAVVENIPKRKVK